MEIFIGIFLWLIVGFMSIEYIMYRETGFWFGGAYGYGVSDLVGSSACALFGPLLFIVVVPLLIVQFLKIKDNIIIRIWNYKIIKPIRYVENEEDA